MTATTTQGEPQLLRLPYQSTATGDEREFLVYLPRGYGEDSGYRWPVLFLLHGGGERGDGRNDLDYVLHHGPLGEAWIKGRDLPFVMVAPQLPVFGMTEQLRMRAGVPKPQRQPQPPAPLPEDRPAFPIARMVNLQPTAFGTTEAWGDEGFPGGWQLCEADVFAMLDRVLADYATDPDRVYLTGISYGGNGTWVMALAQPDRWAAIAPICGDANHRHMFKLAARQLPIWIFHGGRDPVVKVEWAYELTAALEAAGHRSVRFTVHEDLGHDCWTRVYGGQDLYTWFLQHRRARVAP